MIFFIKAKIHSSNIKLSFMIPRSLSNGSFNISKRLCQEIHQSFLKGLLIASTSQAKGVSSFSQQRRNTREAYLQISSTYWVLNLCYFKLFLAATKFSIPSGLYELIYIAHCHILGDYRQATRGIQTKV